MLRNLHQMLFRKGHPGHAPLRRSSKIKNSSRPAVEMLEDRRLLAASFVPDQVLLQFKAGVSDEVRNMVRRDIAGVGSQLFDGTHAGDQTGTELVTFAAGRSVDDVIQRLKSNPAVAYAEPNWIMTKQVVSNDSKYLDGSLWGMYGDDSPSTGPAGTTNQYGSQAEKAWADGNIGSNTVYVGVIDEGIDFKHPDLASNIWTNPYDAADGVDNDGNGYVDDIHGWDFSGNNNTIYDGSPTNSVTDEHGTHVAGTIGAVGGNGVGVAGMNWNVQIISGKFLAPNGGYISDAIKAVDYFVDLKTRHGLNIVALNNSWGGGAFSQAMQDAITRAANANILFIAAAGNGGSDQVGDNNDAVASYPSNYNSTAGAGYDSVVAVAAISSTGGLASFSNYGATTVDLGAPGVGIWSTTPNGGYISYSGTSMATPHVTGAAALYAAANPSATASQIKNALLDSARRTPTDSLAGKTATGGRLNVSRMAPPANDLAITGVAPSSSSVAQGGTVNVVVTVQNVGTQPIIGPITVTLQSNNGTSVTTDDFFIEPFQSIPLGLEAGASASVTFIWNTTLTNESPGSHTLTARHGTTDENPSNDTGATTVAVTDPNAPKTPLYLTVADAGTVTLGGLAVQNEDIVLYDGGVYTLFFDGTPALGGSSGGFAIDAVAILSDSEFLISVDQYGGTNDTGITVYDEDILKFTKNGAGTWVSSMYFDGSDVGLKTSWLSGTTGAEGVDAIELLSDGKILVSTKGNFSVSGLSGADEDVIAFTPTSTGPNTAGSWAMYFDGSNNGLGDGGENEDVDGISVDNRGKLYLSTKGNFSVAGRSGTGSDVFVFSGGIYSPNLYFTGSTLGGKTLFSIDLPPGFISPASASSQSSSALKTDAAPAEGGLAELAPGRGKRAQFGDIADVETGTAGGQTPTQASSPAPARAAAQAGLVAANPEIAAFDRAFTLLTTAIRKRDAFGTPAGSSLDLSWDGGDAQA